MSNDVLYLILPLNKVKYPFTTGIENVKVTAMMKQTGYLWPRQQETTKVEQVNSIYFCRKAVMACLIFYSSLETRATNFEIRNVSDTSLDTDSIVYMQQSLLVPGLYTINATLSCGISRNIPRNTHEPLHIQVPTSLRTTSRAFGIFENYCLNYPSPSQNTVQMPHHRSIFGDKMPSP